MFRFEHPEFHFAHQDDPVIGRCISVVVNSGQWDAFTERIARKLTLNGIGAAARTAVAEETRGQMPEPPRPRCAQVNLPTILLVSGGIGYTNEIARRLTSGASGDVCQLWVAEEAADDLR